MQTRLFYFISPKNQVVFNLLTHFKNSNKTTGSVDLHDKLISSM